MNPAIIKAIDLMGSQSALAASISVTPPAVAEWRRGARPVPVERCVQIEQRTAGAVRRWDLRPTDWHRIWPELIGLPGAPALSSVPQVAA